MAEVTMQTIIVKNTDSGREGPDGGDYSETMRVPGTLWRKVGGRKGIEEAERGLAQWLRVRNPAWTPALRVTFIREEDTKASDMTLPPPEVGQRFVAR